MSRFYPSGNDLLPKVSTWYTKLVKFLAKGTTNDGSTLLFEGRDSDNNIVFSVDTNGNILGISGGTTVELAPVISATNTPPGVPTLGDRYLITATASGAWVGKETQIAEWGGASWSYTVPTANNTVFVTATLTTYRYTGSSWIAYAGTAILQNGNTLGLKLVIGTNDANTCAIKTNGIERIQIDSSGNITFVGLTSKNLLGTSAAGLVQQATLTSGYAWMGNGSNVPTETATVTSTLTTGDFNAPYTAFATESNWTNDLMTSSAPAGVLGDKHYGTFETGVTGLVEYTQVGWKRFLSTKIVVDGYSTVATNLVAWLLTSGTWTSAEVVTTATAGFGDTNQEYYYGGYEYKCISNVAGTKTWRRSLTAATTTLTTDATFMNTPQTEVGKADNGTFTIAAKYNVISIIAEAETTTAGNLSIGTADGLTDVVASTALPIVVGTTVILDMTIAASTQIQNARTYYINIDSAATVKLHLIIQKQITT